MYWVHMKKPEHIVGVTSATVVQAATSSKIEGPYTLVTKNVSLVYPPFSSAELFVDDGSSASSAFSATSAASAASGTRAASGSRVTGTEMTNAISSKGATAYLLYSMQYHLEPPHSKAPVKTHNTPSMIQVLNSDWTDTVTPAVHSAPYGSVEWKGVGVGAGAAMGAHNKHAVPSTASLALLSLSRSLLLSSYLSLSLSRCLAFNYTTAPQSPPCEGQIMFRRGAVYYTLMGSHCCYCRGGGACRGVGGRPPARTLEGAAAARKQCSHHQHQSHGERNHLHGTSATAISHSRAWHATVFARVRQPGWPDVGVVG